LSPSQPNPAESFPNIAADLNTTLSNAYATDLAVDYRAFYAREFKFLAVLRIEFTDARKNENILLRE
jgi:hypothetical protein